METTIDPAGRESTEAPVAIPRKFAAPPEYTDTVRAPATATASPAENALAMGSVR
jgi:hypothetical protein